MSGIDLAAAIGGGLQGGLESWNNERAFAEKKRQFNTDNARKEEQIVAMQKIAEMKADIQKQIADLNEAGRNGRHDAPSGDALIRAGSAADAEAGRNQRWNAPSGNALLGGQVTMRGQDMNAATAADAEAGRNQRWNTTSGNAKTGRQNVLDTLSNSMSRAFLDAGVKERGQDMGQDNAVMTETGRDNRAVLPKAPLVNFGDTGATTPKATLPPVTAPPRRPSVLQQVVPRGGGASAAPAPGRSAVSVGQVVTLKDGSKVRVTSVKPDGSFEGESVSGR